MVRSVWKGKFITFKVYKKFFFNSKNELILKSGSSTIIKNFINCSFKLYNGKVFKEFKISGNMVGNKFGGFSKTRKAVVHTSKK